MSAPYDYPATTTVHTTFVHPEYSYWVYHWQLIRDSIIGEVEIKRKNTRYLPKVDGQTPEEYAAYLDRAVFFNMSQRTLTGLLGTLFRRNAVVQNLPDDLDIANISKQNQSLGAFVKEAAKEVISMGRYGVLLDMDEHGNRPPYLAGYITENITDWTIEEIDGRWTPTEIILRELRLARPILNPISLTPAGQKLPRIKAKQQQYFSQDTAVTRAARRWIASYRVLRLERTDPNDPNSERVYRQYYHTSDHGDASPEGSPFKVFTPTWRGKPFNFIPFHFLGPYDLTPDIDKSPLLDIILLNHSHYKSYAQLEHGRFYTALPVYYCPRDEGEENASYTVGPSVVWEVGHGEKPGIIEFNGSGLKYLESACDKKEDQIAALGGRLVGVERVSAGESNNQLKVKEANENALLLNVANVLDTVFTAMLRWWAFWQDVSQADADKIIFETNKDFLLNATGAREFRAIQMMFEAGILPLAVLHDYLKRAEVVPDWMSLDQFQTLLTDADSFPNQADVQARQRGAPNAAAEWEAEHVLVDPAVVAVRGYDSQAPLGQQPLPGQTQGGAVTAAETMPQGMGAPPPPPPTPAGTVPAKAPPAKTGPGVTRRTSVKQPKQAAATKPAPQPVAAPTDDVGTGGTPGGAPGGPLGSDGKHPRAQNTGSGEVADLNLAMNTITI